MKKKAPEIELMRFGVPNHEGHVFVYSEGAEQAVERFKERVAAGLALMEFGPPRPQATPEETKARYSSVDTERVAAKIIGVRLEFDKKEDDETPPVVKVMGTIKPTGPMKSNIIGLLARKFDFSLSPRVWANHQAVNMPGGPKAFVEIGDILTFDFANATPTRPQPVYK